MFALEFADCLAKTVFVFSETFCGRHAFAEGPFYDLEGSVSYGEIERGRGGVANIHRCDGEEEGGGRMKRNCCLLGDRGAVPGCWNHIPPSCQVWKQRHELSCDSGRNNKSLYAVMILCFSGSLIDVSGTRHHCNCKCLVLVRIIDGHQQLVLARLDILTEAP